MRIIVPTTTHYSDCWPVFSALFRKFWPDCQFPVTLITDTQTDPWDLGDSIVIGEDKGWCNNFHTGLLKIKEDFILMMQEDFFLNAMTDTKFVNKALGIIKNNKDVACFRLYPCPGADIPVAEDYGLISCGSRYRISCQAAIWRKTDLLNLLHRFNRPNEFEIDGTNFVNSNWQNTKFLAVRREDPNTWPLQYYCTAIVRGNWDPGAIDFVKAQGIPIDLSRRGVCPRY